MLLDKMRIMTDKVCGCDASQYDGTAWLSGGSSGRVSDFDAKQHIEWRWFAILHDRAQVGGFRECVYVFTNYGLEIVRVLASRLFGCEWGYKVSVVGDISQYERWAVVDVPHMASLVGVEAVVVTDEKWRTEMLATPPENKNRFFVTFADLDRDDVAVPDRYFCRLYGGNDEA